MWLLQNSEYPVLGRHRSYRDAIIFIQITFILDVLIQNSFGHGKTVAVAKLRIPPFWGVIGRTVTQLFLFKILLF